MLKSRPLMRSLALPVVIAVLTITAGCGAPSHTNDNAAPNFSALSLNDIPQDGTPSSDGLTVKDYQTGTLPTDPYRRVNPDLYGYALNIAVNECLSGKNLAPYPYIVYDWNDPTQTPIGGWSKRLTVETASQYGYHLPPPTPTMLKTREISAYVNGQPESWTQELQACIDQAHEDPLLGDVIADDLPLSEGKGQNQALAQAFTQWRECMQPLGIPDLPDNEPGIADSLRKKFNLSLADGPDATSSDSITDEEIRIATHDAQCLIDSGYDTTYYGLVWAAQNAYVQKNQADLTARRQAIMQQEQALKTYIEQHR